jgi:hypothetical protein
MAFDFSRGVEEIPFGTKNSIQYITAASKVDRNCGYCTKMKLLVTYLFGTNLIFLMIFYTLFLLI